MTGRRTPIVFALMMSAGIAAPLAAAQQDQIQALDTLTQAATGVQEGIAAAREQIASGELAEAASTLERVLLDHPEAPEAVLLHASLLCRLDDRDGGLIELTRVRAGASSALWAEADAACQPALAAGGKSAR